MKQLFITLCAVALAIAGAAQSADTTRVGKIVYLEGRVELGSDARWMPARMNAPVRRNQLIRTPGDGMAEIAWNNGSRTIVGPNSNQKIVALHTSSSGKSKAETDGMFNDFKRMFSSANESRRAEEGGIRRSMAEVQSRQAPDEIYWKEDREISYEEASALYEAGEYGKAVAALQAFLHQKPTHEMAKYAQFALGHSYVMVNNPLQAQEIFQDFISRYPADPMKPEAEKVLSRL
jgi:tetratricopeptide (TPR) repeat protein